MKTSVKHVAAAIFALSIAACSGASEEETAAETGAEPAAEEAAPEAVTSEAASSESPEVFEVCDEAGNRYPSEADAEAAGLDRAEYGATFCEYAE